MSKYLADQNQFAYMFESGTYGTSSGALQWVGLVQDVTVDENENVIQVRYQGSTDRNVDTFEDGNRDFTGTFTYFPQDWKFLGYSIGSISETGSADAGAGSHIFTETNSDNKHQLLPNQSLASFTVEDSKNNGTAGNNFIRTVDGCMIDTYTLTLSQGEIASSEVAYMGQNLAFTSGAVVAVTPVTTRPYIFSNVTLQIPSGVTVDNATEVTFSVNNNLEAGHYLNGSRVIKEPLPLNRDYELTTTVNMDNTNAQTFYRQYFLGGSTFNAMLKAIAPAGSLFLTMSGCKLTDMDTPSPVEGTHEQSLTIVPQTVSAVVFDDIDNYNAE